MLSKIMTKDDIEDAYNLISAFLSEDEYYLATDSVYGGFSKENVRRALELFADHPGTGGVFLTYLEKKPVAVCIFSYAISTSLGAFVVKMDDVYVAEGHRGQGIGERHINGLKLWLWGQEIKRIDTSVHNDNAGAKRFYEKVGFKSLNEEKLSALL